MKIILLLPVMALMLSCNFITGLGSGSSAGGGVDLDSPADPVNVTVELNEDETTSAVVPPEGGELTLTSADGSIYTLEVPPDALLADTEISMTTISSLEGGPVESNVYGVQLEPSGLAFYEFLTLTIQPAAEIPLEEQFMFKYEGNGEDFHHAMVDPNTEEIRIKLLNFSGVGFGVITERSKELGKIQESQLRIDNGLGELLQTARNASTEAEKARTVDAIEGVLNQQQETVGHLISKAKQDCQYLNQALEAKRILDKYRSELGEVTTGDDLAPIPDAQTKELNDLKEKCPKAFSVYGNSGAFKIDGTICNIYDTFILTGNGPNGCVSYEEFNPVAGSLAGRYHFLIEGCPLGVTGSGNGQYTVNLNPGGGGALSATYSGGIMGMSDSGFTVLVLTPLPAGACK